MNYRFENGEIVTFEHEKFGRGKAVVLGWNDTKDEYIIYPKNRMAKSVYPFMCFLCKSKNLISTPF